MQFLDYKYLIIAAAMVFSCNFAAAFEPSLCEQSLESQSSKSGLPSSLTKALASNLAIGPKGKMYPYSVQNNNKTYIEKSANNAFSLTKRFLRDGAKEVRVGCLGVSVFSGQSDQDIMNALNPTWNVATALNGINSNEKKNDIEAPLAAITNSDPLPIIEDNQPTLIDNNNDFELNTEQTPLYDRKVGTERDTPPPGGVKSTWGLFNNIKPSPLTTP